VGVVLIPVLLVVHAAISAVSKAARTSTRRGPPPHRRQSMIELAVRFFKEYFILFLLPSRSSQEWFASSL